MKVFLLSVATVMLLTAKAQVVRQPLTVRYAGLGAYSKNFSDVFSVTANVASLASLEKSALGVYSERRFMLEELSGSSAIIAVPSLSGTIGLQADYFGSTTFNESQLGLIYARRITEHLDVGVKFNYHVVRTAGYGNAAAVNLEAGVIYHLTETLHTGVHVYNPASSKLGKNGGERLGYAYRFGLGYEASDKVFLSMEIVKQEDQPVGVNAGLQYNLHEKVFIRTGISTNTNNSYVGVGLQLQFARIDINTAYHPQLGFTPGLLLIVNLAKKQQE